MGISVFAAIVVGLACSFVQSLGLTIQRKSHVEDEAKAPELRQRAVRRPLWIVGFAVYISSNVFGSVFQIGALPIVVLAPLGGISLLWNSVLAHLLLGEGFTSTMMLGTILIAGGAVLIAIFGVVPDSNHSLDELMALWARGPFLVFFSAICFAIAVVLATAHMTAWRLDRGIRLPDDETSDYASPTIGATEAPIPFRIVDHEPLDPEAPARPADAKKRVHFAALGLGLDLDNLDVDENRRARTRTLVGLAFAAASGTLSGLCLVIAKAAIELVIATIDYWRTGRGTNEFTRVQTWFLVAGLGVVAILQLVYLNYSLTFASPALICPLAFCFFNLASIFDGLVFYNQLSQLSPHQITLVSVGVAILLVGVWVVSAIQPTGQGGVEVGTWAEDESLTDEPLEIDYDFDEAHDELEAANGATFLPGDRASTDEPPKPLDPRLPSPIRTTLGSPPPVGLPHPSTHPHPSQPPLSAGPHSPTSPHRRRRPRYGTLIPEFAPGAPTGFAFGIGAASPGFALRSNSISHGSSGGLGLHGATNASGITPTSRLRHGHARSRSEDDAVAAAIATRRRSMPVPRSADAFDSGQVVIGLPASQPIPEATTLPPTAHAPTHAQGQVEHTIAAWATDVPRSRSWWPWGGR